MNRTITRTSLILLALLVEASGQLPAAELTFESLVENLKTAEMLYKNLDVKLILDHENGPGAIKLQSPDESGFRPQQKRHDSAWCVSQSDRYRVEVKSDVHFQDNGFESLDHLKMFDGETTRVLNDGKTSNIRQGYSGDDWFIRPHMLLLRRPFYLMPLSVLLSGHDALVDSPQSGWKHDFDVTYSYQGAEELDGLTLHPLSLTLFKDARPQMRINLWLAEERNFIPAKASWYHLQVSTELAIEESNVVEWMELEPGIWFPKRTHLISHNPVFVKLRKRQEVQWTEGYTVQSASLRPNYDRWFFQSLEVPNGAAVYESVGTQITRSYRKGAPETPRGPTARKPATYWWILWLNAAALSAVFLWRKARK